jgi:hypothetical protein
MEFEMLNFENHIIKLKQDQLSDLYSIEPYEFVDELNSIVPIVHATVPYEKSELFIIEYSQFVERFILPQKNILDTV